MIADTILQLEFYCSDQSLSISSEPGFYLCSSWSDSFFDAIDLIRESIPKVSPVAPSVCLAVDVCIAEGVWKWSI